MNGSMILTERLSEFFPVDSWQWNDGEVVTLDMISDAINKSWELESEPFGDTYKSLCQKTKSTEWHIRRILYFIFHPQEIKDIDIDNVCYEGYIFPAPTIVDGNHRFMAAMWLNNHGKMNKVHCTYGGRLDVLDYLTGETDICPEE